MTELKQYLQEVFLEINDDQVYLAGFILPSHLYKTQNLNDMSIASEKDFVYSIYRYRGMLVIDDFNSMKNTAMYGVVFSSIELPYGKVEIVGWKESQKRKSPQVPAPQVPAIKQASQ